MAHSEACQLYIEEQIKEGLAAGKTPYSIGKELTAMVERLFEAGIPSETLRSRARYIKKKSGEITTPSVTPSKPSDNLEKRPNQVLINDKGKFQEGTAPGPGRRPKHEKPIEPYSCAMQMARIAVSQLSRIPKDDPKREKAFKTVIQWIKENS
jgi:hypothetical protein